MENRLPTISTLTQQWVEENLDLPTINEKILALDLDEEGKDRYYDAWKKLKIAKRQSIGFILMITGAIIGFISGLLCVINPLPELYYWFLYGFTSLALVIIFIGLYYVLE